MSTMRTIAIVFFTTTTLFAQDYQIANNDEIDNKFNGISDRSTSACLSVSSLALEIYQTVSFDYGKFLEDAKNFKKSYLIAGKKHSKIELVKIFRKGALKTENPIEFEQYLKNINSQLLLSISERESVSIYYKFREGSKHAYLDK